jgi:hypothetical protein
MIGITLSGQTKEIRGFYVSFVTKSFFYDIGLLQDITTKTSHKETILDKVLFYDKKNKRVHLVGNENSSRTYYTYDIIY